jgi:hypothetical protein
MPDFLLDAPEAVSVSIDDASLLESRAIALAAGRNGLVDLFRLTPRKKSAGG